MINAVNEGNALVHFLFTGLAGWSFSNFSSLGIVDAEVKESFVEDPELSKGLRIQYNANRRRREMFA